MKTLSCKSPYGIMGMGAHFAQIVEETRVLGELQTYFSTGIHHDDALVGQRVNQDFAAWVMKYPLRYSAGLQHIVSAELFDFAVARLMSNRTDCFGGFSGQFLRSARKARGLGMDVLELHSPTAHINVLKDRYEAARSRWSIEQTWITDRLVNKQLKEYDMADKIYVNSEYTRQTFLDNGVNGDKLVRTFLQVNPRFKPSENGRSDETFRVVYTGSMTVTKGIPLLLEAFSRFPVQDAQLVLIGGWSTRGMRQYMEKWISREPRILMTAGDPLPFLQNADCYVHPSYQDGYGYAPMEAMMCEVPVVVTEDTGMKENVIEGENGYVVPTGSWEGILEGIQQIYRDR